MKKYSSYFITGLRILVGWHFLYEGIVKLLNPEWSAKYYLMGSRWIFSDLFHWMASSSALMSVVDFLNVWGLILIGLALILGLFTRWVSAAGAVLLLFYFVVYPPIPGYTFGTVSEGSYLWINKTLIEFFILIVFTSLPEELFLGADSPIKRWREEKARTPIPKTDRKKFSLTRRELLHDLIGVPVLGAFAYALYKKRKWDSFEEKFLTDKADAITSATLKTFQFTVIDDLKGTVPHGKIGNMPLSRLILGGNLIGGWAHARDLLYVSKLIKSYHTDEKVIMTLQLAEKCGINALLTHPMLTGIMNKYWRETDGKMQFISDCGWLDFIGGAKLSIDRGAHACYCQGATTDILVQKGDFDTLAKGIDFIRQNGLPAGIGAHLIESIQACVQMGIKPDFWVKTLHDHSYWSARVDKERKNTLQDDFKENIFCFKPEETIDFMNTLEEPWIAFKVLAAGAIKPEHGFSYAFNNGADFVCVGMYDFQIVDDVNITLDILSSLNRSRPWRA